MTTFAVFYRPDLSELAEAVKREFNAVDLSCSVGFSHVLILGGDGTLLEAIRRFPCIFDSVVVHLGLGKVNFYRSAEVPMPPREAIVRIISNDYRVVDLATLEAGGCTALNEVSFFRREHGRLLSFKILTEEGEIAGRADGVIVSTPHGTSGYVVSTYGPIVDYRADVVVISFIAPFTLFLRPLVLSSRRIEVETGEEAVMACDGKESGVGRRFVVERGKRRLRLAVFGEFNFLNRVMARLRSL